MKNPEKIVPIPEEAMPLDPVAENMSIMTNKPIKVFPHQDHKAHMEVHLNAMSDPRIGEMIQKSPSAPAIMQGFEAHIAEHMALKYRGEIEDKLGVELPDPEEQLPPDVENDVARLTARASQKVLEEGKAEFAKEEAEEVLTDPVTQISLREVALKEKEAEHQEWVDKEEIRLKEKKIDVDKELHVIKAATTHHDRGEDREVKKTEIKNKPASKSE